jgi:hypothetical protein
MNNPAIEKAITHYIFLAVLGAASVLIMPLFATISNLNISSWPLPLQSIYTLLLPIIGQAVVTWQKEIQAQLQTEENAQLKAKNEQIANAHVGLVPPEIKESTPKKVRAPRKPKA